MAQEIGYTKGIASYCTWIQNGLSCYSQILGGYEYEKDAKRACSPSMFGFPDDIYFKY